MKIAGLASGIGLVGNMVASYIGGKKTQKNIEAQNILDRQSWMNSLQDVRDQLTIAYNRVQQGVAEINRDKLASKMAVRKAAISAKGEVAVESAQLGIAGRRGARKRVDIVREEEGKISDISVNTEVQMQNAVNAYNDAAAAAVQNLNNRSPIDQAVPSTSDLMFNTLGSGLNYYNKLSKAQQSDLKSNFTWKTPAEDKLITTPQIGADVDYGGYV